MSTVRKLALLLVLAACAGEKPAVTETAPPPKAATPPPSVAEARALIESSAEFGEYQFTDAGISIPMSASLRSKPAEETAIALARAKWINLEGGDIGLTSKARGDKRFLPRENGILDIVPLAKKKMGDVSGVSSNPDGTAVAGFTWSWEPNEIGALMAERFAGERKASATLIHDGTSWGVLRIDPAGQP